jgi:ribosomal protein L11 methylase PrmA
MGYFLKNELDKGKNIVELGCGIGVLSVSLKVAGFRNVLATDLPEVIQVTAKNASMNEVDLEVQQLDWYQPRFIDCEVVLLADCVWINELLLPLVRTLKLLLKPGNRAFACNKMRSRVVYQRFLDLLEENFLAIENVHQDEDYFISVITAK